MENKRTIKVAAGGGILAGLLYVGGHFAGWLPEAIIVLDEPAKGIGRNYDNYRVPPIPIIGGQAAEAIGPAVQQAASTFKALRNGDQYDKIVYEAACAAVNSGLTQSSGAATYRDSIYSYMPAELQPGGYYYNSYVSSKVEKAANALAIGDVNSRAAAHYAHYCLLGGK